jgi:hypothetical protein
MIAAADVAGSLSTAVHTTPRNERQARELAPLPEAECG